MNTRKRRYAALTLMCTMLALGPTALPSPAATVPSAATNVTTFGAVGDGVTDSTAAINAALLTGNDIYLPAGTYVVTGTLYIPSHTNVYGAGEGSTIIKLTQAVAGPLLSFGQWSSWGPVNNSSIQQLTLDGGNNSQGPCRYLRRAGCCGITVSNVEVKNIHFNGMGLHGRNMVVQQCSVHDCYGTGILTGAAQLPGVTPAAACNANITGNYVTACQAWPGQPGSGARAGIIIGTGSRYCTAQQNTVVNNAIALCESGANPALTSTNNSVLNNTVSTTVGVIDPLALVPMPTAPNAIDVAGPEHNFTVSSNNVTGVTPGWDIFIDGAVVNGNVLGNTLAVAKVGAIALNDVNAYGLNLASTPPNSVNVEFNRIVITPSEQSIYVLPACTNINVQANTVQIAEPPPNPQPLASL